MLLYPAVQIMLTGLHINISHVQSIWSVCSLFKICYITFISRTHAALALCLHFVSIFHRSCYYLPQSVEERCTTTLYNESPFLLGDIQIMNMPFNHCYVLIFKPPPHFKYFLREVATVQQANTSNLKFSQNHNNLNVSIYCNGQFHWSDCLENEILSL